ncbi:tetratricopeptide repeat protein [Chryseolinea lacunae]|uniref:Tetratricopeptide repeat protein n=1 Tax=Chryseolinea lacunae TaxID=2801331 RepID=A0ABS1KYS6_9BACT|nr:tetratricopeptide repeat protein [Chryseolinea lacunae]MBL0744328.1 tetratricopeptide repeat protein [Chryseolinea lacunae]
MIRSIILSFFVCVSIGLFAQDQLSQNKVEKLYRRGTELVSHSNFGAARQVFTEFLAQASPTDSRRSEAEYYVAFSALSLGNKDGEKLIDDFIDHNPSSPKASTAYYDLANFFYSEGNYIKAASYFKKVNFPALTLDQQSQGHFKWGYSYFNQKKLDEALEQFNFVKRLSNAYTPASNYYAGYIEYSKGKYDEALFDLKKAESSPSYSAIVPYLIANIYYKQGRYDTVIEYVNTLKGRSDLANANEIAMLVAEAQYYKGDYKKALEAYDKYLGNNAKAETGILFRAGYANYAAGNTAKGIEYLDKAAAAKDTVSYYASYYLGILYLKQGNKPYASNAFNYARKNPKDPKLAEESAFQYAKVSYDAGKPDLAIDEFERFLKTYPSSTHTVEVKELLAQGYVNGNNFNKAIEYIDALPSRSPYINQAYQKAAYLKGSELFNKEEYEEAVVYFKKSLEFPNDPNYVALASFWSGEAYSIGKKYEEAATHYLRVVGLGGSVDPEILVKTRYGLGYAYFNLQTYDKALFSFKEFVNKGNKSTPNYADGVIRLGDCYYVSRQYDEALANYNKARTLGSTDSDYVLLQSGMINGIQRKYGEARTQLTELVRSYPKSQYKDEAIFQRAQFEIEQGNYQQAADALSQLIREGANSRFLPYAYMRRGASYFNLKQYDRTISDYTAVIQKFPGHPAAQEVLLPLQEVLSIAGRSSEFEKYMTDVKKASPDNKGFENIEFETAKNFYFDQQYQKTVTSFSAYVAAYPLSAKLPEARYYMAESYYRLKDFDKALPLYRELSNDATFAQANKTVARLAEIEFKQGKFENAVTDFKRVERVAASKKDQYNAWSGLMESFYALGKYDSADVYAKTILERGNVSAASQNKASLYLGKTAVARGDLEGAKDEFLNTLNSAHDEYGAEAKYSLAEIFYKQKQYKQCYETLVSLNNDFASYPDWVGKSFLLLADNFVAMDDLFQAKATLQSLIDKFPLQNVKDEAKRRLSQLDQKEAERQKQIQADTVDNNR